MYLRENFFRLPVRERRGPATALPVGERGGRFQLIDQIGIILPTDGTDGPQRPSANAESQKGRDPGAGACGKGLTRSG